MKKNVLLLFLSLGAAFGLSAQPGAPLAMFNGNYKELQTAARQLGKPYFVFFYTNWCMPCKKIFDEALRDKAVVNYAAERYLAMAVDAESAIGEGKRMAQFYNVHFFPMLLAYTPEGKVVERIDGYLTPAEVLAFMKRNADARGEPMDHYIYLNDDPPMSGNITPVGKGLYKLHIEKQPSDGYGWQLGVFENYESLLNEVEVLQNNFHRNILVHVNEFNSKTVYHLILGPFNSRRAALTYGEVITQKYGKAGLVVHLATMK
jgi:thiol-disulfide isomerase/thioredoxin